MLNDMDIKSPEPKLKESLKMAFENFQEIVVKLFEVEALRIQSKLRDLRRRAVR